MKKLIIGAILSFSLLNCLQAQIIPSIKLGVKGALNFTTLYSEGKVFNSDAKTGYQLGLWGRVGIAGFHVQPEAYFVSKKVGVELTETSNETGEGTFKSLDVPILLGTRVGLGPIGFRIQAGPVFSFAQKGDFDIQDATRFENYKKNSTGIIGGIGVDISKITVDLRYEHGLSNMATETANDQKIRMWSIGLGYSFL